MKKQLYWFISTGSALALCMSAMFNPPKAASAADTQKWFSFLDQCSSVDNQSIDKELAKINTWPNKTGCRKEMTLVPKSSDSGEPQFTVLQFKCSSGPGQLFLPQGYFDNQQICKKRALNRGKNVLSLPKEANGKLWSDFGDSCREMGSEELLLNWKGKIVGRGKKNCSAKYGVGANGSTITLTCDDGTVSVASSTVAGCHELEKSILGQ